MTTMTTAQRSLENAQSFREKLGILHRASVGVILCRSSEPYRAIDTIRAFAWAEPNLKFKYWTVTGGWHEPNKNNPEAITRPDGNNDLMGALRMVGGAGDEEGFDNGIYPVFYPHHWIGKVPALIQLIKDYAGTLPETQKRVILMCPPEFTLPIELRDDVVILDFELPSYPELVEIYNRAMSAIGDNAKKPRFSTDDVDRVIAAGSGMTSFEFETALSRSIITHRALLPRLPIDTLVAGVMEVKVEAVKRTEVLEVMPVENMENVGGLQNLKTWVEDRRACFTQEAMDYGIDQLKGVLLAGPPGTGKSLISKAIAHALGLPLIKFDVSRVFASLVGQSEQRVSEALKMAEAMAPCVLFLDEIDKALGGSHEGGGDSGVSKRVLGKILTWLQENDKPVFCVFSANRVENLPSELIRKGRLDEIFSVSVPDASEREQVLQIHLRKRKQTHVVDLSEAVEASANYVPAELEAAVKDALIKAFTTKTTITGAMIADELRLMTPLSTAFADQFQAMQDWAERNARPANGSVNVARPEARTRTRVRAVAPSGQGRSINLDG